MQHDRRAKVLEERRKFNKVIKNDHIFNIEEDKVCEDMMNYHYSNNNKEIDFNQLFKQNSDQEMTQDSVNSKKNQKKKNHKQSRYYYASQFQVHDFLLKQDLELLNDSSFMVCIRPSGQRCLVTSGQGKTVARNSQGFIQCSFNSYLPNGGLFLQDKYGGIQNKGHCAVFDCIYDENQKTFYVLDLIVWEDLVYQDFPFCSRILFLQQKFANMVELSSNDQEYKFKLIEQHPCNVQSFLQLYYGQILSKYVVYDSKETEVSQTKKENVETCINKDMLLKDLQDQTSEAFKHYQKVVQAIKTNNWIEINEHKLFNDLDYAIRLLKITSKTVEGQFILKDGFIFSHLESLYEKGLNTLVLHWRDKDTSIFYQDELVNGMVDTVLRLNDNHDFETLEEDVLEVSMFCKNKEHLVKLKPGKLYNLKISIQVDQVVKVLQNQEEKLKIYEFVLQKKTSKIQPDHLSKIISKFVQSYGLSIDVNDIVTSIEQNIEPCLSISTKSLSVGHTVSNDSNKSKMSDITY